jgi:nucleotidyltransferase/DNA polymerase involved in DNA repair
VGIKLVRADFIIETRETTFAEPQFDKKHIASAIDPLLNRLALSDKEKAIRKVGLKLSHLSRKDVILTRNVTKQDFKIQKTLLDYI